jgi:hypothetical protein
VALFSAQSPRCPAGAGGDGVVNFWDGENKKRLHQITGYPTSIAALAFNAAATQLAVASSYTFEQVGEGKQGADEKRQWRGGRVGWQRLVAAGHMPHANAPDSPIQYCLMLLLSPPPRLCVVCAG